MRGTSTAAVLQDLSPFTSQTGELTAQVRQELQHGSTMNTAALALLDIASQQLAPWLAGSTLQHGQGATCAQPHMFRPHRYRQAAHSSGADTYIGQAAGTAAGPRIIGRQRTAAGPRQTEAFKHTYAGMCAQYPTHMALWAWRASPSRNTCSSAGQQRPGTKCLICGYRSSKFARALLSTYGSAASSTCLVLAQASTCVRRLYGQVPPPASFHEGWVLWL